MPAKPAKKRKDDILHIRASAQQLEDIKEAARQANCSTSEWIRKTLAKATQHVRKEEG